MPRTVPLGERGDALGITGPGMALDGNSAQPARAAPEAMGPPRDAGRPPTSPPGWTDRTAGPCSIFTGACYGATSRSRARPSGTP